MVLVSHRTVVGSEMSVWVVGLLVQASKYFLVEAGGHFFSENHYFNNSEPYTTTAMIL